MSSQLYLSFWHLCLENLPQGQFERSVISADDARAMIRDARTAKTLLCVPTASPTRRVKFSATRTSTLRQRLKPVLLRRTRSAVMKDLPPRPTEIVRIAPTDEQTGIELAQMQIVSSIVRKAYISEMDLLRLQKALLLARMNADSTLLVDKHPPGFSSKLERLEELLGKRRFSTVLILI